MNAHLYMKLFAGSTRLVTVTIQKVHVGTLIVPTVNCRVIIAGFFRDVNGTGLDVFLDLSQRLVFLVPSVIILSSLFNASNI